METIHKMVPVGLCRALLYTGACCLACCVRPGKTHLQRATFCSFAWIHLGWYLQTVCWKNLKNRATERVRARYFFFFVFFGSTTVSSVGLRTAYNAAERRVRWHELRLSAASDTFAWVLLSFVFPTEKGSTSIAFLLFWFCVCGFWLLSPSYSHLAFSRSG